MKLNVPIFSQNDPAWKNKKLGFSSVTFGGYGCLVTCIAMLAKYYGKDTDPDKLNQSLKDINGFANQNLYKWYEGVPKIYTDMSCTKIVATPYPITASQWEEMKKELQEGRPVILQVDFIPATSNVDMHFVLLVGYEDGKWIVNDPWFGDQASLDRYGKPEVTVQQYVFHAGPVQVSPVTSPELQACLLAHTALMDKIQKELEPKITDLTTRLQETSHDLEGAQSEITTFKRNQTQLATTLHIDDQPNAIIGAVVDLQKQIQGYKEFQAILVEKLKCDDRPGAVVAEVEKWLAKEDAFTFASKKIEEQKNEIARLVMQLEQAQLAIQENTATNSKLNQSLTELTEAKSKLEHELTTCQTSQRFKPLLKIFDVYICKEVTHA